MTEINEDNYEEMKAKALREADKHLWLKIKRYEVNRPKKPNFVVRLLIKLGIIEVVPDD